MKIALVILSPLLLITTAHAAPKKMECKNNGQIEEWAERHPAFYTQMCDEFEDANYCAKAKNAVEEVERCLATGQTNSHTHYMTFDSDHLVNGKGEKWVKPCWAGETLFEDVKITSTFSVISFQGESESEFNVDRKTLRAGWNDNREYICTLSDLDTSENKL